MSEIMHEHTEVEVEATKENKPYTLRRLNGGDLWPVLEIMGKVLPEDLAPLFVGVATGERNAEQVGSVAIMRIISAIMRGSGNVKNEVYAFLASVSGLSRNDIDALGVLGIPKMIWEIYKAEKNADFFGESSKSS